jgi:hypothetical protein
VLDSLDFSFASETSCRTAVLLPSKFSWPSIAMRASALLHLTWRQRPAMCRAFAVVSHTFNKRKPGVWGRHSFSPEGLNR